MRVLCLIVLWARLCSFLVFFVGFRLLRIYEGLGKAREREEGRDVRGKVYNLNILKFFVRVDGLSLLEEGRCVAPYRREHIKNPNYDGVIF